MHVMHEVVHGCAGDGFVYTVVEARRVDVGADREGAFLVGRFHEAVETFCLPLVA